MLLNIVMNSFVLIACSQFIMCCNSVFGKLLILQYEYIYISFRKKFMKKKNLLYFLLPLMFACSSPKGDIPVLDMEYAIDHPVKFDLGEYVSNIKYIPLETNDNCLIKSIRNVITYKNDIYISRSNFLYKFSLKGKFIKEIGTQGRGPAEFKEIPTLSLDSTKNELCISENSTIVRYDTTGNFISRHKIEELDFQAIYKVDSNGNYFFKLPHAPKEKIAIKIYDKNLKLLKNIKNTIVKDEGYSHQAELVNYNGDFYYNSLVNDTIFSIDKNFNKKAHWVIDYGKYKIPINEMSFFKPSFIRGYHSTCFYIGKNINLFTLSKQAFCEGFALYFNKQDKLIRPEYKEGDKYLGIMMNGLEWQIEDFNDDEIIMSLEPIELLENIDKVKDPKLKALSVNLKEESNPILAIVKIKE